MGAPGPEKSIGYRRFFLARTEKKQYTVLVEILAWIVHGETAGQRPGSQPVDRNDLKDKTKAMKRKTSVCLYISILLIGLILGSVGCHPQRAALISISPAAVQAPAEASTAPAAEEASPLVWLLPALMGLSALLCIGLSFAMKRRWQRILLWALALLLLALAALLLLNGRAQPVQEAEPSPTASPAPTDAPVYELSFTTETLPETADLAAYPELQTLDLTACEQVDAARYEAIRQTVPASCQVLWAVPLTDGRFPADSTELVLPHFSEEDAALLPYFEDLTAIDASGSTAYDALLTLFETQEGLSLTFTLPAGDQVLTMDDRSLTVTDAPDLALLSKMLPAFPLLQTLDMTEATVDPAEAAALAEQYPELSVLYSVPIGRELFPRDAESIALDKTGVQTAQEVLDALPYLPSLTRLDLHGTGLVLSDLVSIREAYPDLALSHRVELLGEMVETEVQELDLRGKDCSPEELSSLLKPFESLQQVYLPEAMDGVAAEELLRIDHPETAFVYQVTAFGKTLKSTVEELDVSKTKFSSTDKVKKELANLPHLKKLIMCDCGLKNAQMEELMEAFPQIKFVWYIHLANHKLRTDAVAFSTKNPSKHTSPKYTDAMNKKIRNTRRLKAGELKPLKYCTDLIALDLGHNYLTSEDLEVLQYLPHLQLLILADNKITDISALHQLKELRYVELFMNRIPDMSPLVGLENLVDINIANTHFEDITPLLSFKQAKRLWFSRNGLTSDQIKTVVEALPGCKCNYTSNGATDEGWRSGESYQWLRGFFYDH